MPILTPGYHVTVVVEDIQHAMAELTEALGFTWHVPRTGISHMLIDDEIYPAAPLLTYSHEGPPYMELIQRLPGTVWGELGLHHVGFFADDMIAESNRLAEQALPPEVVGCEPDGARTTYCYHLTTDGFRFELFDAGRSCAGLIRYLTDSSKAASD